MEPFRTDRNLGSPEELHTDEYGGRIVNEEGTHLHNVDVQTSESHFRTAEGDLQKESKRTASNHPQSVEKGEAGDFDLKYYFEDSVKKGLRLKKLGVSFENITAVGMGADASVIPDNLTALKFIGKLFWPPAWKNKGTKFDILHEVSGFCKDGEMLLVLGRPGAGCSSLLRIIANERSNFEEVKGKVTYGGIPAEEFHRYLGEAIYVPEEDLHFPTLTLHDTLDFALKMKTPGERFDGETKRTFRERMLTLLLNMFGLKNQADTVVGNEWIRGLSGGERKRLTISEAMVSQGSIDCWDCSTRGLDAASALDYAKSLRVMANTLHKTTIATFYQAGEAIYQQFDNVLVLDSGRCIYFGPISEAKQHFIDLGFECEPRKSTPDFLTGVTNAQERKIRPGWEDKVPSTSFALEAAWKNSEAFKKAEKERALYAAQIEKEQPAEEFRASVRAFKAKRARNKSIYNASIFTQVMALLGRQAKLMAGDKFGLITRYFTAVFLALLYGSVFFQIPLTSSGGYERGGALFVSLLFSAFLAQAELPRVFMGRNVIAKQKSYAFYHPAAYHIAQVVMDIPVVLVQEFIYSSIAYFMFDLANDASKFFIFVFTKVLVSLSLMSLIRTIGIYSPSIFFSQQVLSVVFISINTYTGYFIPHDKMHPWLVWIYYINPLSYGFRALFANEMRGVHFDCTGSGSIPFGSEYTNQANRVCVLPGSTPGDSFVTGEAYLKAAYDIDVDDMAICIIAIMLFWFLYVFINCVGLEYIEWVKGGFVRKVYKGGNAPKVNDEAFEKERARKTAEANKNVASTLKMNGGNFLWRDVKYTVPVKGGTRLLLDNVDGWIKPGQMTALMGASGAGKTTLLDVLAKRKTLGKVEGTFLLNGLPLKIDFERITGYVEQMDVHDPFLTIREALRFSAKLRQDPNIPLQEKYDYVEKVLEMMEMSEMGDALIGSLREGVGISVEERKRLTIGMELVAKPHILFLDEPTSGLDAQSSYNIIKFIRNLANAGMPLVCTIHQPSSVLFEYFDRLLLLAKGGKVVYFGDIGENSRTMLDYFEQRGARPCSITENPAEYILEAIGAGVHGSTNVDWASEWNKSEEKVKVREELDRIQNTAEKVGYTLDEFVFSDVDLKTDGAQAQEHREKFEKPREFATGFRYQTYELTKRLSLVWWRNFPHTIGRVWKALSIGLLIGFTFWDLGYSTSDLNLRILALFQILILGIQLIIASQPAFMEQRLLFQRDYASKFYGAFPFSLGMIIVDLPYILLCATLCMVCSYWSVGFDNYSTAGRGFYFWIAFVLFVFFCISFGQVVAAMSPNIGVAMLILPLLNSFLYMFAGVIQRPQNIPGFWKAWMYPLDPWHYLIEGMVTDVLHGIPITCVDEDFYRFYAPNNTTCGDYTQSFFQNGATGYLDNPQAGGDEACRYCQYSSGDQWIETYDWSFDHRWRNFGILACYWIFNILVGSFFIYLFRKQRR